MHFLGPPNIFSFHVLNLYGGHLYRLNISKTINLLFTSNFHSLHTCATLLGELFEFQAILELDLLTNCTGGVALTGNYSNNGNYSSIGNYESTVKSVP